MTALVRHEFQVAAPDRIDPEMALRVLADDLEHHVVGIGYVLENCVREISSEPGRIKVGAWW